MGLLQHVAAAFTGLSTDYTRTLTPGGNRLAIVCVQQEGATEATFTATLDGVPMVAMEGGFSGQVASAGNSQHLAFFALLANNLGEGDVTLNVTSSITEDNTSVHFVLLDDADQTFTMLAADVDYETGTTNPKTLSLNPGGPANYTVIAVAGNGNQVNYASTYDGEAPDSEQEVDNGATTTGYSAVWEDRSAVGNNTLSFTSTPAPNRSAVAAMLVETNIGQVPGRVRSELVVNGPAAIFLSDRYLETRLLSADDYQAVVTCDMNRNSTVIVELFESGVLVDSETLAIGPNDDTAHVIQFTTVAAQTIVKIGHDSVTGNTASGVIMSFASEIQTASGSPPEDEGSI